MAFSRTGSTDCMIPSLLPKNYFIEVYFRIKKYYNFVLRKLNLSIICKIILLRFDKVCKISFGVKLFVFLKVKTKKLSNPGTSLSGEPKPQT